MFKYSRLFGGDDPDYEIKDTPEDRPHWKKHDALKLGKSGLGLVDIADGHVFDYNLTSILRNGFFLVRSPTLRDGFILFQALLVLALTILIAFIFTAMHAAHVVTVQEDLVEAAGSTFNYFAGLMAFLFGFFVFDTIGSYKQTKNQYLGGYWGAFTDLMLLTASWYPSDAAIKPQEEPVSHEVYKEMEYDEFSEKVSRWGLAVMQLLSIQVGTNPSMNPSKLFDTDDAQAALDSGFQSPFRKEVEEKLVACELLTAAEADIVSQSACPSTIPLVWMLRAYQLKIPESNPIRLQTVERLILQMRQGVGGCVCAVTGWGLAPLPLVHLMSGLVKLQFFLLAFHHGLRISYISTSDAHGKFSQMGMSLLMVIFTPIIFQSLLEIVNQISNPFGSDWIDFPIKLFHKWLRDDILSYMAASARWKEVGVVKV